jgi:plastocyanin
MENFDYQPRVTVPAGTTIVWVNFDTDAHSATADDGTWDTGLPGYDEEASVTFAEPGTTRTTACCTASRAAEGCRARWW